MSIFADIDIQACIHDAVRAYLATPPSTYLRKHDHTYSPPTDVPPEAVSSLLAQHFTLSPLFFLPSLLLTLTNFYFCSLYFLSYFFPLSLPPLLSSSLFAILLLFLLPPPSPLRQLREPLSLDVLRQESCPHISAHDVIALCGLEYHALGYGGGARESGPTHSLRNPSSPLQRRAEVGRRRGKSGKGGRKGRKGVLVDIRSQEEYPVTPPVYVTQNN